jgi:hypothetical protein
VIFDPYFPSLLRNLLHFCCRLLLHSRLLRNCDRDSGIPPYQQGKVGKCDIQRMPDVKYHQSMV